MPNIPREYLGIPIDKVIHFIMFVPFVALSYLSFDFLRGKGVKPVFIVLAMILVGALFAVATEVGQSLTSYRSGDPRDFLADSIGLAFSTLITAIIIPFTKK